MGDRTRGINADAGCDRNLVSGYGVVFGGNGAFSTGNEGTSGTIALYSNAGVEHTRAFLKFNSSLIVPTGAANTPRSWGALACAYFGQPSAA